MDLFIAIAKLLRLLACLAFIFYILKRNKEIELGIEYSINSILIVLILILSNI